MITLGRGAKPQSAIGHEGLSKLSGVLNADSAHYGSGLTAEVGQRRASRKQERRPRPQTRWPWVLLSVLALAVALLVWWWQRPKGVAVIQPTLTTITETIASSGRVAGVTETLIGAQATGIVTALLVHEGERVTAGQRLALLHNDVAEAQVAQAQEAVRTAQAQLLQVSRGPLRSEVEAALEQVRQAHAQLDQQRAAVAQAEQVVVQAQAQLDQLKAERDLAAGQFGREAQLVARGLGTRVAFEETEARQRITDAKVRAQGQVLAAAQSGVRATRAGVAAAQANGNALEARWRTVQAGARAEDMQVARQRVEEAEQALRVARLQAANAIVTAPFAGIITAINTAVGQTLGVQGVLHLVSAEVEIRVEVDESNLADLAVGQEAIISSSTFRDSTFRATVSKLSAAVDVARGTVMVTLVPAVAQDWLRPGQTVQVNIVTNAAVQRLLVPPTALSRVGDRQSVLVIEQGQAQRRTVLTRPPTEQGVPVLAGLNVRDRIIANAHGTTPGDAVCVRGQAHGGQP